MVVVRDLTFYQVILTLDLSFIEVEFLRAVWGRPEFTVPKPKLIATTSPGYSSEVIYFGEYFANQCSVPKGDLSYMPIRCG